MADPIKAAKTKAARKWDKLESQTVPLYGKISSGKATDEDFKKLAKLYDDQSKLASKTFQQSLDAAKASAKDHVKATVKKSVKAKQLLSTPELQRLLETTISIVLEKSADLIRTAVSEALEENIDQVTTLIKDVRRMQVKNDEVLYRLRKNATIAFTTPNFFQNILNGGEKKKTFRERFADLLPSLPKLPSFRKKKDEIGKDIERLADLIAAKVTVALTAFDEFKAKTERTLWDKLLNRDNPKSVKSRIDQAKLIAEEFLKRVIEFLHDKKRSVTEYLFGQDSFFKKSFDRLFNRQDEIDSKYAVRTAEQIESTEKLTEAIYDYKSLDDQYIDDELDKARDQESTFSDTLFTLASNVLDKVTGGYLYQSTKDSFAARVAENTREDLEEVDDKLTRIESQLKAAKDTSTGVLGKYRSYKAYFRYRNIVFRDAKKRFSDAAKEKLDYVRRRVRRYGSNIWKFVKWFGIAYLASLVINSLQNFMPTWREDLKSWMANEGAEYLEKGGKATGEFIGQAISSTLKYMAEHSTQILGFMWDVLKGMTSSILNAALIALGLDPGDVFGGKKEDVLADHYEKTEGKGRVKALFESAKSRPGNVAGSIDTLKKDLYTVANDEDFDVVRASGVYQNLANQYSGASATEVAYDRLLGMGLTKDQIQTEVTNIRNFKKKYKGQTLEQIKETIKKENTPKKSLSDSAKKKLDAAKETAKKAAAKTGELVKTGASNIADLGNNALNYLGSHMPANAGDIYANAPQTIANLSNSLLTLGKDIAPWATDAITSTPIGAFGEDVFKAGHDKLLNLANLGGNNNSVSSAQQLARNNVLEPEPVESMPASTTNLAPTMSVPAGANTSSIPTFLGGDIFVQNGGLTGA